MTADSSANKYESASHYKLAAPLQNLLNPINTFLNGNTSGGIVLLAATVIALLWANCNPDGYNGFWGIKLSVSLGRFTMSHSIADWINDGLMTVFFLSVGLEIKREMQVGDLSSFGQAILPVTAAAGGMLVPALLFTLCAHGTEYANGWGIPVATDIAFALGAITMLGKRVPNSLKIFLVALAIADDLGAVLVIALFYSSNLHFGYLGLALVIFGLLILCNKAGLRSLIFYCVGGLFIWLFMMHSGVHSTLAGVMLAITIPSTTVIDYGRLRKTIKVADSVFKRNKSFNEHPMAKTEAIGAAEHLKLCINSALPPLVRLENALSTPVAMIIMPIFALANAGVVITKLEPGFMQSVLTHGIALGLILGKPIGITLGTFLTVKIGLAKLPRASTWTQLFGVGMLGGIGFTMSLFVTGLALHDGPHMNTAKLAILCSSTAAGVLGYIWLFVYSKTHEPVPEEESEDEEAETPDKDFDSGDNNSKVAKDTKNIKKAASGKHVKKHPTVAEDGPDKAKGEGSQPEADSSAEKSAEAAEPKKA
ncbi:Na+/H+ antiporter NhaA [bacterium]|nr:Na+/H+ antiporter NhaA [bacterium]